MGYPPWHMWGSSQTILVPDVSDGTQFQTSQQLARINYARPETWSFFFGAELLSAPEAAVPNLLVIVQFQIMIGVGRGMIKIAATENGQNTGFVRFVWKFGAKPIMPAQMKWTTTARTPPLDEGPADPLTEAVTQFPAQDIQVDVTAVTVTSGGVVPGTDPRTLLNCHAYFAPVNHIRPEWFNVDNPDKQFRAGEQGGM